ncbi:serine/threonine protein kinase [Streptomyces sp. CB02923]|uniref:serine/threonine-protein kinase n=1 Tax=Streptomyces sp. CB02923 TaxID=1718985 RepID=UPI00093F0312|nr:serine/threonine-protein kinase [Streptomyces sp. CB02923]OKI09973.1 serine/threonine protein kinase [Streptomyces sp. CB02923]
MGSLRGEGRLIAGRYRLGERLGRGGMGTVWRATDEMLRRQVAVKELHLDDGPADADPGVQRARAMREARTVARIKHPNVIVLHDVVEQDARPWIVMELVDGASLADRLTSGGPLAPREVARIGLALLGALRVAHARGVLHRDIKPANVLLEEGTGRVVLTDFGVAQVPGSTTLTEAGGFVGSPEYTAPERMSGHGAGPAADLWSVGVLLCAALSGESPFRRDTLGGVLSAVVHDEIELPEPARPLLAVVRGLLERDPDRRLDVPGTERLLRGYLQSGRAPETPPDPPAAPERPAAERPGHEPGRTHGVPIPDALADRALAAAARPHTGRARTVLLAGLTVCVLAAAGLGIAALVLGDGDADGKGGGSRATPTRPSQERSAAPGTATTAPGPGSTAPPGYRMARDPLGFALAVPDTYSRSYEKPRVFYTSADRRHRIGIHLRGRAAAGPLDTLRRADAEAPGRYPGYRDGTVTRTTHRGLPAARWEFTWDGGPGDGGARHTYDLVWEEGGRTYDVWVSAPLAERDRAERHFTVALRTFHLVKPAPGG